MTRGLSRTKYNLPSSITTATGTGPMPAVEIAEKQTSKAENKK